MIPHRCFSCGAETRTAIQNVRPPAHAKYICKKLECAQAWWRLAESRSTEKAGNR